MPDTILGEPSPGSLTDPCGNDPNFGKPQFLRCEYLALREEIKEAKSRIFKLAVLGIIGVPSVYAIASDRNFNILVVSLPPIVCAVMFLYLSESLTVMRAGAYIKERIEPNIKDENGNFFVGWEHWLENASNRRAVDKLVGVFFYALYGFYYSVTSFLALDLAKQRWPVRGYPLLIIVYLAGAVILLLIIFKFFRYTFSTKHLLINLPDEEKETQPKKIKERKTGEKDRAPTSSS
jgi:hypothetical protein